MTKNVWLVLICALGCGSSAEPEPRAAEAYAASAPQRSSSQPTTSAAVSAAPAAASEGASASSSGPAASLVSDASLSFDRQVIRNATLQLTQAEPVVTTERATTLAVNAGGFLLDGHIERISGGIQTSQVVLRVPSTMFEKTLAAIRGLGTVREEKVTGQDVTAELVDSEARTRALRVMQARLLALLERTGGLSDLLQVEQELARVGAEIERYEGRLRFLHERVAMASIELTVFEPEPMPVPVVYQPETLATRFVAAFGKSANLCVGVIEGGIVALGFVLPSSVFIIISLLPFVWLRRRLRATRPAA